MSVQTQTQVKPTPMPMPFLARAPTGLVQRKCACGGSPGVDDECEECRKQRLRVQRRSTDTSEFHIVSQALHAMAQSFDSAAHRTLGHDFGRVAVQMGAPERIQTQRLVSQPGDPYEQEADRAAAQVTNEAASASRPALSTSSAPLAIRRRALEDEETLGEDVANPETDATETAEPAVAEATPEAVDPATEPMPEVAPAPEPEEAAPEPVGESRGGGLIVEDEAGELMSGQMRKNAFLDEMRTSACAIADAELAAVGRSTEGCPYIEQWIGYYRTRDSAHIERAIRKYAPETTGATSAREYIPLVSERIRQGVARWARTGELTGVPEELLSQAMGGGLLEGIGSAVSSVAGAVSSVVSGIGSLLFKEREGGAREATDPQAIRSQLGSGSPLDGGVRRRMESAFGHDFSRVRVHTDGQAANLSSSLNARAFTIGRDIAFGLGEYQPGTLIGDALVAHELAHVVQQGGADSSSALMQKGGAVYNSLEEDADVSAVGAVVSLWSGAKRGLANIAQNAIPRLRSGLRLQRCPDKTPTPTTTAPATTPPTSTPTGTPAPTPDGCVTGNLTAKTSGAFQGGWNANSYLSGATWGNVIDPGTAGRDRTGFKVQMVAPFTGAQNLGVSQTLQFTGANQQWLNGAADYFGRPHGSIVNSTTYSEPVLDASDPFASRPWFLRYSGGIASFADVPRARPGDQGVVDFVTCFHSKGTSCTYSRCCVTWRWSIDFTAGKSTNTVAQQSQSCN